ncbi:hypothetical protein [Aeromicrobium fastidiosum]|uniref:NfeD-like C-terminal domain-containing protein n=1 Tax=Aeromicrobium fastidiosum TaxID=52699 RepID=A0A641AJR7_9ACTN|nr:hypothetical protein [Aeromicrobium fastidiosum]KAA1372982.1 hypothetical protein ESP62_017980 [Aeromicrobium fastidiosum]MBP2390953.1 membrane protein implicated in regulation of membrane protease activity [Aeromicrobium fastidiosum]
MLFLVLAAIGLVMLLVSVVFDGLLDVFDLDTPFLSGTAVAAFLSAFGLTGLLLPDEWGTPGVLAAAAVAGLVVGGGAGLGMRAMQNTQTDANVTAWNVVGTTGTVVSPIRVGAYGEVAVTVAGHRMKYNALADTDLPLGSSVAVVQSLSPSAVKVAPLV